MIGNREKMTVTTNKTKKKLAPYTTIYGIINVYGVINNFSVINQPNEVEQ